MLNYLKKIKSMPYHIRKKVLNRFYSVLMYTILCITLFPIVWMIYTSFMNNSDIIQGKVTLQRAHYNVLATKKIDDENIIICTSDGAVNKFNINKNKVVSRKNFKSYGTNYAIGEKYIWLSSANKGLIRIDINKFSKKKKIKVHWSDEPIDFNKISKTFVAVDNENQRIWLSLGYKDYDNIIEYDLKTLKEIDRYNILSSFPYSYEKLAISHLVYENGHLFAASNRGLAVIDTNTREIVKLVADPDFSISEIKSSVYDQSTGLLYLASNSRVYTYDFLNKDFKFLFTTINSEGFEQINNIGVIDNNQLLLTTGHGLVKISKRGRFIEEINLPMFDDVDKKGHLVNPGEYVNSDIATIETTGPGMVVLGTSSGRVSVFNPADKSVLNTILIDKKSFLNIRWRNYIDLFHNVDFGLFLRNSFIVCFSTAFIAMLLATITAYALVRFDFPGNRFISTAILSTQMIPGVMMLIPIYIMFIKFTQLTGIPIKGTFGGMIFVYSAFFLPFSIWILRGFFASIPVSLEEAATIDGCTPLQVFYKIALPLSIPGIVATGIFIFLVAWDELMFAWVLSNAKTMTIPVGIRLFVGNFQNRYDLLMAASTVATIPVMLMFVMLQKQIVSGLTSGAVKG